MPISSMTVYNRHDKPQKRPNRKSPHSPLWPAKSSRNLPREIITVPHRFTYSFYFPARANKPPGRAALPAECSASLCCLIYIFSKSASCCTWLVFDFYLFDFYPACTVVEAQGLGPPTFSCNTSLICEGKANAHLLWAF